MVSVGMGRGLCVVMVTWTCAHTGFISMLVTELWGILEGGACDHRIVAPRAHPLDPMDRASHKVCTCAYHMVPCYMHVTTCCHMSHVMCM